jgi:hypothetical protein
MATKSQEVRKVRHAFQNERGRLFRAARKSRIAAKRAWLES